MEPIAGGRVSHLLAGLEVGIWGGVVMLGWLGFGSAVAGQSAWTAPDLLSVLVRGRPVASGLSIATFPGLALHLATSGAVGVLFGLLVREMPKRRVRLMGLAVGLVWYYLSIDLFWKRLGGSAAQYLSPGGLLVAYLVFGVVLGCYSGRLGALRRHREAGAPAVVPVTGSSAQAME